MNRLTLLWLVLGWALIGCGKAAEHSDVPEEPGHVSEESGNQISLSSAQTKEADIVTETARFARMQAELKVVGTVASNAKKRALVTPPASGKILRLFVSPGDVVARGQSLAILESPDLAEATSAISEAERGRLAAESEVRKGNAELELASGRLKTAQTNLARQNSLAKAGAFSQPSLQVAQSELNEAQSDLQTASEDTAVHKVQLARAERLFKQELISRTDLEQAQLAVTQDSVHRERAEKRVGVASANLRREQEIARKDLLTAREVQAAEAEARTAKIEVQRARIAVDAARASLKGAENALRNAKAGYVAVRGSGNGGLGGSVTLTAPISGTITTRKATVGQAVERASELFEIEDLETVWVTASVPESEVEAIHIGLQVRILAASYPNRAFRGDVQLLGNHLDAQTRTMPVQCAVRNPGGLLREGMFATVLFGVGKSTTALVVPDSAIDRHGKAVAVYVSVGDKFEKREVGAGRSAGGYTEILSGLKAGEKVVSKGLFVIESELRKGELKGED